ncbi:hypothetical protein HPB50_020609 [Hyalomma asiaticum]|uniref:Uncharacterized protein n=1 Tax=Hyalomma asiaticum TaxID=266040 RepID=A0ACB7S1M7_HYAAI|nr:hypothetical protein HPB50_020609 [Hyalomma asiaticum]
MLYTTVLTFAALAIAVHGRPSARTFGSPQHPEHFHDTHNSNAFSGVEHGTVNHGHEVPAGADSSVSILVCQVVKVPVGQSGAQPAHAVPAAAGTGSPSVVSSSQEALSNLNTRVRTAVERIVNPVVTALQNASLWLNRTSQLHLNQSHNHALHHQHQSQHAGHVNHAHAAHNHQQHQHHMHGGQVDQQAAHEQVSIHPAHGHQKPQAAPNQALPMTVVSVPVLVPAVHAGSIAFVNLSSVADVPSLHFSGLGQNNATLSAAVAPVNVTSQPASTPVHGNLVGRSGDLPTAPATDTTVTLPSYASTPTMASNIITIWFRSGHLDNVTETSSTLQPTTSPHLGVSTAEPLVDTPTTQLLYTEDSEPPVTVGL